jgi:hypothetical protein
MSMNKKLGLLCALALAGAACGSNTTTDDAATTIPGADAATTIPGADAAVPTADTGTTPVAAPYVWVVVQDTEQVACTTNGPGADIDAVGKMDAKTNTVIAWGKAGTARFIKNPLGNACDNTDCSGSNCKYAAISKTFTEADLVARTEGPVDGTVAKTGDDTGYFSLNAGTLQMQLADATTGALVSMGSGDWIVVYEVDQTYITSGAAYAGCTCLPEHYEVYVQTADPAVAPVKLTAARVDSTNASCSALTATSTEGCGTTVFVVP